VRRQQPADKDEDVKKLVAGMKARRGPTFW